MNKLLIGMLDDVPVASPPTKNIATRLPISARRSSSIAPSAIATSPCCGFLYSNGDYYPVCLGVGRVCSPYDVRASRPYFPRMVGIAAKGGAVRERKAVQQPQRDGEESEKIEPAGAMIVLS
ncbi:unnamed protein product [Ectocarpus sp. CCAP 1310/34]|nr:unnamed protein product [Ectocarpus sp. CCAP 1310/34]